MASWLGIVGFRRHPIIAACLVTAGTVAWIGIGTTALDGFASTDTRLFVRDGIVRWPLAALLFVVMLRLRGRWAISTLGLPKRPTRLPWATIALTIGCLILAAPLTQFWTDGSYTAAVLLSEIATGVFEELGFRGLIFCGLVTGLGRTHQRVRLAMYLSCALFGLAHGFAGIGAVMVTAVLGALFLASTLELQSLWPAAILHGLLDVGVNGPDLAPDGVDETWGESFLIGGDLVLFAASIASLIAFALWRSWPIIGAATDERPSPQGEMR